MVATERDEEELLRQRAVKQVRNRRDFFGHLLVFVLVNAAVITIWATVGGGGFFWPLFLILSWGIGLVMHAWDVFYRSYEDEGEIRREIDRIRRHAA
jgi:predicted membrane channel-forming protein YqfA (hemolysin III family)